jgi:hypothetical protein
VEIAMTELSQDARALIEQERSSGSPRRHDKTRVRSRLIAELGSGAFASSAVAGAGVSASDARALAAKVGNGTSIWLKGVAALATVAAGAAVLYVAGASRPQLPASAARPPMQQARQQGLEGSESAAAAASATAAAPAAPAQVEATTTNAGAASAAGATALVERSSPAQATARRPRAKRSATELDTASAVSERAQREIAVSAPAAATSSSVAAELALLARAQRALREGRTADALAFAHQHATNFANGALSEERLGIETLARCMSGERPQASARAFLERAPSSPLAARVRKECGLE